MQQTTASTVTGLVTMRKGIVFGETADAVLGTEGATIGGFVGGTIGYMVGSKVGKVVSR